MKSLTDTYVLSNGVQIPCIGFGTWQTPDGEVAVRAVRAAIEAGYRHIDTAAAYGNEEGVGQAVRDSGVRQEDLFITSKLQNPMHGYENTKAAFEDTMRKLHMDYLDLYLIHWPNPLAYRDQWEEANAGTWRAMEEFYAAGRIRSIGVSNFRPHHLETLAKTATIQPMVNQIKLCPGLVQEEVVTYCRAQGMVLQAYSPLGTGSIFDSPQMQALARKYGRSIAQVSIRWSLQMGYLPLPKSVTPERIQENAEVFDFTLSDEDVTLIAGLAGPWSETKNPDETTF